MPPPREVATRVRAASARTSRGAQVATAALVTAGLALAGEQAAHAMQKCEGDPIACCNWVNSDDTILDKRIVNGGVEIDCAEVIEIDGTHGVCGVNMDCLPGDLDIPLGGDPWGGGGGGPIIMPLDMCEFCGEQGDKCLDYAGRFENLCVSRMRNLARHHCTSTKTDCAGRMIDDYTIEALRDEHGKYLGVAVHGPGIDRCVNDCMVGIPGHSEASTITGSIKAPDYFAFQGSQTISVQYGGAVGIYQSCFNAAQQMGVSCASGQAQCETDNDCPATKALPPVAPPAGAVVSPMAHPMLVRGIK